MSEASILPEADRRHVVRVATPFGLITAAVRLTGASVTDGGDVWLTYCGRLFCARFRGTTGAVVELAQRELRVEGAAECRRFSRAVGEAWRAAVDIHCAARHAQIAADTQAWREDIRSRLVVVAGGR